jgi:hypothetical protein
VDRNDAGIPLYALREGAYADAYSMARIKPSTG